MIVIHFRLVTDKPSNSVDAPGWSRASITSEPKHNDTMADLERSALFISKSNITEKQLIKEGNLNKSRLKMISTGYTTYN